MKITPRVALFLHQCISELQWGQTERGEELAKDAYATSDYLQKKLEAQGIAFDAMGRNLTAEMVMKALWDEACEETEVIELEIAE